MLRDDFACLPSSESDPLLHAGAECLTQSPPPVLIRLLAHVMTGLHFLESVGTTFIIWLCPSLAPEPRLHQYISSTPSGHHHVHHQHESHRQSHISSSPNHTGHTSSPRRRHTRLQSLSTEYNCFIDNPESPKFAEQRRQIMAIFEEHRKIEAVESVAVAKQRD